MARVYIAALLIQHASRTKAQADFVSANRMANEGPSSLLPSLLLRFHLFITSPID